MPSSSASPALWPLVAERPLPRLHVLSDVHLEHGPYELASALEYDVLIAAGDIGPLETAIPWLAKQGRPVIYVLGNHEYWDGEILERVEQAKSLAQGTCVHVLERESIILQGVRFLGCTLWTDLRRLTSDFAWHAGRGMRDYRHISCERWAASPARLAKLNSLAKKHKLGLPAPDESGKLRLTPGITYLEHQTSRQWLKRQLQRGFDGPTVVVTHHAPSDESLVRHGISREKLNVRRWGSQDGEPVRIAAYASEGLLQAVQGDRALLWVHGHTHSGMDYLEGGIRVVCNPRGRPVVPLTEESAKAYALFGISVSAADIQRSQEAFQRDPYRGDAQDFDCALVVDFEQFLQRPLALATKEPLERVRTLAGEIKQLLPHLGAGKSVPEACVGESVERRLESIEAELARVQQELLTQLDEYARSPALCAVEVPQVPRAYDIFDSRWRTGKDELQELRSQVDLLVAWLEALPGLPARALQAWRVAAARCVVTAAAAGSDVLVCRLPVQGLKRAGTRDIRLVLRQSSGDPDTANRELEKTLDQALNSRRGPREWLLRVWEAGPQDRYIDAAHLGGSGPG